MVTNHIKREEKVGRKNGKVRSEKRIVKKC